MKIPEKLLYTKDHEWLSINNNTAIIGITDYAQGELGDIIFLEYPEIGLECAEGEPIGTIEAVKTVADIYSPIKGKIKEINIVLENDPGTINKDPYIDGWIVKMECNSDDVSSLLSYSEYIDLIS